MEVVIALRLPRDAASVPMIRQMLNAALGVIGVDPQTRDDIQLMLAEACSNVIRHADQGVEYAVAAEVSEDHCVLRVADDGRGLPADAFTPADGLAETGRGLQIMRALSDVMRVSNRPERGVSVFLEKTLHLAPDAPGRRLQTVSLNGAHGSAA
jgi:serine/threonine-protein kinase RsbW